MNEWAMMQQMVAGSQLVYLQLATMLCLFLVIVFRPERIRYPMLMKWAYWTLIASIVAPVILNLILGGMASSDLFSDIMYQYMGRNRRNNQSWLLQVPASVGPMLLGISMLLGFSSLAISTPAMEAARKPLKPSMPQKHPLDD